MTGRPLGRPDRRPLQPLQHPFQRPDDSRELTLPVTCLTPPGKETLQYAGCRRLHLCCLTSILTSTGWFVFGQGQAEPRPLGYDNAMLETDRLTGYFTKAYGPNVLEREVTCDRIDRREGAWPVSGISSTYSHAAMFSLGVPCIDAMLLALVEYTVSTDGQRQVCSCAIEQWCHL